MSDYNSLKNSALTNPTGNLDLGSATNRYGNIFLQGNLAIGNLVATETSLVSPKISSLTYAGNDTAADPTGSQTITVNGSGFSSGAAVYVAGSVASAVTVVSSTQVTFSSPAKSAGNYTLILVNSDGGTATFIPGMQYSGVPSWSTSSGSLASVYEYDAVSSTLAATSDSPVTYSVTSGALPTGVTLTSATGVVAGTAPSQASGSTTYNFTTSAIDGENQDTPRNFSVTVNADAVTWSSPADSTTYSLEQGIAMANVELSASSAAGKAITYTADSLPTGLNISGSNIVGTPTVAANTSSTLTATASTTNKTATKVVNWTVSVATDAYFKSVSLLLTGDGVANNATNSTFTDSSTTALAMTKYGNTAQGAFSPFSPTGWSAYFDGSGDYLTTTGFGLSTDFTVEFWSYLTAQPTGGYFMSASSSGPIIGVEATKTILGWNGGWILNPPNDSAIYPNGVSPLNQWNHWAVVRSSGTIRFYLNGVMLGSSSSGSVANDASMSQTWGIGASNDGQSVNVPHYMSNFRMSNVARYSGSSVIGANFTLPTADFVNDINTILLTLQSNRFKDNSTTPKAITAAGDAKAQAFSPYAPTASYSAATHGGSMYFDGNDNLDGAANNSNMRMGTGDYTVEGWFYQSTLYSTYGTVFEIGAGTSGTGGIQFSIGNQSQGGVRIYAYNGTNGYVGGFITNPPLNTWNHIAWVRSSGVMKIYLNGVGNAGGAHTGDLTDSSTVTVGGEFSRNASFTYNGYISDLRVVKGTAVYTGNFTPPTATLTAISGTSLLLKGTSAGIIDASGKNDSETVADTKISTSVKKYGTGSIYFDGTGDYLLFPATTNTQLTGNFTIEFWMNPSAAAVGGGDKAIVGLGSSDPQTTVIRLVGAQLQFWVNGSTSGIGSGSTTNIAANTWYHVALVRYGTASNNVKLYLNGVAEGSLSGARNDIIPPSGQSSAMAIGRHGATQNEGYYIDEFRVSKGVARYTTNFTPPTAKFNLR
jgi:hypothetical protein